MKNYCNSTVRRQDRLLDEETANTVLLHGEYGFLSLTQPNGDAYGLPISYVVENDTLFLHCAPEGMKLRCIETHPEVSFCVVGHTHIIPEKFTTEYQSVILRGKASIVVDPVIKQHALELILNKYCPDDKIVGMKYAEKSFHRTAVIRIDIVSSTGKCKQIIK